VLSFYVILQIVTFRPFLFQYFKFALTVLKISDIKNETKCGEQNKWDTLKTATLTTAPTSDTNKQNYHHQIEFVVLNAKGNMRKANAH
jgi:hypothetical protein